MIVLLHVGVLIMTLMIMLQVKTLITKDANRVQIVGLQMKKTLITKDVNKVQIVGLQMKKILTSKKRVAVWKKPLNLWNLAKS